MNNVLLYGLGSFGFSLLKHLKDKCAGQCKLWAFDRSPETMEALRQGLPHPYVKKGFLENGDVIFPQSLDEIKEPIDIIILAVTAKAVPEVFTNCLHSLGHRPFILVNTAKALAPDGSLTSKYLSNLSPPGSFSYVYFAGGTIAEDLFNGHPLGATIASKDPQALAVIDNLLSSPFLRLYSSNDVAGVEYCAAFKNVIAIFAGLIKGLGWPYGSETYFISRFAEEVERLTVNKLGGSSESFTISSQHWGNDLWMSCTGPTRNREFGERVGRGEAPDKALEAMKKEKKSVEGLATIEVLPLLVKELESYPFLLATYMIIMEGAEPSSTIHELIETKKV